MRLFEVPRNTRIKLLVDEPSLHGLELNFDHIDGMYSYCTTDFGQVVHISAYAEVEIVGRCPPCNQNCNQGRACPANKENHHGS